MNRLAKKCEMRRCYEHDTYIDIGLHKKGFNIRKVEY